MTNTSSENVLHIANIDKTMMNMLLQKMLHDIHITAKDTIMETHVIVYRRKVKILFSSFNIMDLNDINSSCGGHVSRATQISPAL